MPKTENSSNTGDIIIENNFKVWCKEHYAHINRSECITFQRDNNKKFIGECLWCGYFCNSNNMHMS
ncbi:MAG: hypothetical protein HQK91_11575 [Nitrospirae bacterium]|nr:hypothetical protein [Nitrospirota bacterium]